MIANAPRYRVICILASIAAARIAPQANLSVARHPNLRHPSTATGNSPAILAHPTRHGPSKSQAAQGELTKPLSGRKLPEKTTTGTRLVRAKCLESQRGQGLEPVTFGL